MTETAQGEPDIRAHPVRVVPIQLAEKRSDQREELRGAVDCLLTSVG